MTGHVKELEHLNKKVLVAEDIDINRQIFIAMLKHIGVESEGAENGKKAVEMYIEGNGIYDAILMDMKMPEMDGVEAASTIRALDTEDAKTIPIIAISGSPFWDDCELCMKAGMNEFLVKPIFRERLLEAMQKYLVK